MKKATNKPRRVKRRFVFTAAQPEEPNDLTNERWVVALDALEERNDARELIKILAESAAMPDWVREQFYFMLYPGQVPPLSPVDQALYEAARAYRRSGFLQGEKREHKIARIAEEHAVKKDSLENYLNCKGLAYLRIRDHYRDWFLDAEAPPWMGTTTGTDDPSD